jgi:transcriptional regulator PpsR
VSNQPDRETASNLAGLLARLEASEAALLFSAAADITVVLNADGSVGDRVNASAEFDPTAFAAWPGKAWADVSTIESRPKIEQMIQEAAMGLPPRWRQINHQVAGKADLPVRYCVLKAGSRGQFVAIGRDLRSLAAVQQRLLAAEQSIEQEYARLRHAETRYRLLMQVASEAILVVDSRSGRVMETNAAASNLVGKPMKRIAGSLFASIFDEADAERVEGLMGSLRATGRADDVALTRHRRLARPGRRHERHP